MRCDRGSSGAWGDGAPPPSGGCRHAERGPHRSGPEEFWNEVHVPYHLHIYTRRTLEDMGRRLGWLPVRFFDRAYHDRPWLGLNNRAAKQYQRLVGGSLDAVLEPVKPLTALTSPGFLFYACFGYWLSFRSDMAVVFETGSRPA